MLVEGKHCWRRVRANRAAFLIDGEAYFDAFVRAALRARRSILIVGRHFNSRTVMGHGEWPRGVPVVLGDFLNFLVKRTRRLKVHILDWDFPMIHGVSREVPPIFGLGWKPRHRIQLRFDPNFPTGGSHQQKIIVIDDAIAFVGGMDLAPDRWDTPAYTADDPRRAIGDVPYPPVHDVMVAVDGDAARALGELARERWRRGTGDTLAAAGNGSDPWPQELVPMRATSWSPLRAPNLPTTAGPKCARWGRSIWTCSRQPGAWSISRTSISRRPGSARRSRRGWGAKTARRS
ncbi:MAG: hypothetical protein WA108_16530 [Thiobacillus sp.]